MLTNVSHSHRYSCLMIYDISIFEPHIVTLRHVRTYGHCYAPNESIRAILTTGTVNKRME